MTIQVDLAFLVSISHICMHAKSLIHDNLGKLLFYKDKYEKIEKAITTGKAEKTSYPYNAEIFLHKPWGVVNLKSS